MAELRKITKSPGLSNFAQEGPKGGTALLALADMAKQAYSWMEPAAKEQAATLGAEEGAELARRQIGQTSYPKVDYSTAGGLDQFSPSPNYSGSAGGDVSPASVIAEFEGFRETPYWDVNALRAGYGSDTVTRADGTVERVTKGTRVSREDGLRDLGRRINTEFAPKVAKAVGASLFGSLGVAQQAALTSIAYNYGRLPKSVANAVKSGDAQGVASAIRALGSHNEGINRKRRNKEADLFLSGQAPSPDQVAAMPDAANYAGAVTTPADAPAAPYTPPTLLQTAAGDIEPRAFSPLSGPILQAHRAAQSTAYLAETLVKGSADMLSMSEQYIGDPSGFQQAAQGYIDEAVKNAPEMMRGDLRAKLSEGAQRRFLGMVEENHREIRQRADNASRALVDRYSSDYAEILASGDMDRAAGARAELEQALINREAMPGVAWTRQQSENLILGAQEQARGIAERNVAKVSSAQAGQLRTIIRAAENGLSAEDEAILDDPSVHANNPDLAAEAAGKVALREMMPSFFSMTPGQMDEQIATMRAQPIQDGWNVEIISAMETARNSAVKSIEADPIAHAQQRFQRKPPAIDSFDPAQPDTFVASLQARADYARGMAAEGFVEEPVYLSQSELETLSTAMSKEAPPEVKAALAGAIVSGFGEGAQQVFTALKADPVVTWGGTLMAKGGSGAIATEAMRGQQAIAEGLAQVPEAAKWKEAVAKIRPAMAGLPTNTVQAEGDLMKFAQAIYAARSMTPGFDADEASMDDAVQAALGQTVNARGQKVGGVQTFLGSETMMPVGMNAEMLERKIGKAVWKDAGFGSIWGGGTAADSPEFWAKVSVQQMPDGSFKSAGVPRIGGEPLPLKMLSGDVRFVPVGGTRYRMEVQRSGATMDVHTEDGRLYIMDMARIE